MLSQAFREELETTWLPHVTDRGLDRLIELLEKNSPLLIRGSFTRALPQGCLATQIAWHHPRTEHLLHEAGVVWLTKVVGMNPAVSRVIRDWDSCGPCDWEIRSGLLELLQDHRRTRQATCESPLSALVEV